MEVVDIIEVVQQLIDLKNPYYGVPRVKPQSIYYSSTMDLECCVVALFEIPQAENGSCCLFHEKRGNLSH